MMGKRKKYGVEAPDWAPLPVDATVAEVRPLPGWVMLQEEFSQDKYANLAGVDIEIATLGISNTTYGNVLAVSSESDLGVSVGDRVVYREWEGGRWSLHDKVVLLINEEHILAKVDI